MTRTALCAAVMTAIAWAMPAHSAGEPNQYFHPYTIPAADGRAMGLSVVNAADFTDVRVIEPATAVISFPLTHFAITPDPATQGFRNPRPSALVYAKGGRWYYVDLRASSSLARVRLSSESTATRICAAVIRDVDFAAPNKAWLVYRLAGADNTCHTGDDRFRAARLSDRSTVAPVDLPITELGDFYSVGDTIGTPAQAMVGRDGSNVRLFDAATLQTSQVVASGIVYDSYGTGGSTRNGGEFLFMNGTLRELLPDGSLSPVLHTDPSGYGVQHFEYGDLDNTYFLVHQFDAPNHVKLYRLPRDAAHSSTLFFEGNVAPGSDIEGITPNSIILRVPNGAGQRLVAVAKSAALGTAPKVIDGTTQGYIQVMAAIGQRVFYTLGTVTGSGVTTSARSRLDTASGLRDAGSGSQWLGVSLGSVKDEVVVFSNLLLATGASGQDLNGAVLSAYKPGDGTTLPLTTLTEPVGGAGYFSFGRSGIGALSIATGTGEQDDVFAADLADGRFQRLTQTTGASEAPLEAEGG